MDEGADPGEPSAVVELVESPVRSFSDDDNDDADDDDDALQGSSSHLGGAGYGSGFVLAFDNVALDLRRAYLRRRERVLTGLRGVIRGGIHAVVSTDPIVRRKSLEVMAGIEKATCIGTVMANAIPVASSAFRSYAGFISSTDVCVLDTTGRDNLRFALRMRLDTVHEERVIRDAAADCGLRDRLDTVVEQLTLAERLALAIAMELVLDPHFVFLQDPMRYLSVSDHFEFAEILRRISRHGKRTIVLSSAALPWPIYDALDGLVLLAPLNGRVLFSGSRPQCERFLMDEVLPEGVEARGEFITDLLVQWEEEGELGHVANTFSHSAYDTTIRKALRKHKRCVSSARGFPAVARDIPPCPPNPLAQYVLLFGYTVRRALLRPDFVLSWIGLFVIFFLLAALAANQQHDQNGMQNKRGIIFSLLSCAVHVNVLFIDSEVSEYYSFVHMRNNRYFGVLPYFLVTMVRLLLPRLTFSLIGVAFTAFIFSSAVPLSTLIGLTSFVHALMVLLATFWWPSSNDLVLANLLYYAYSVMFSGFLICVKSFPEFFSDISLLRWGYGGAIAYELRGNPYSCDGIVTANITVNASYCYTGSQYLELEGFDRDSWPKASLALCIMSIVLLFLVLVSMRIAWVAQPL